MPRDRYEPSPDPDDLPRPTDGPAAFDGGGAGPGPRPPTLGPPLRLNDANDLLAILPRLVRRPLVDAVVTLVLDRHEVLGVLYGPLDHLERTSATEHGGSSAVEIALRSSADSILVIAFGPAERVDPHVTSLLVAAGTAGLAVPEALRITDGRYLSYLCRGADCCPEEGHPLAPRPAPIPLPGPEPGEPVRDARIRALLEPVEGTPRATAERAAAAEEERARREDPRAAGRVPSVLRAVRREREGRVTDPGALAALGVHLLDLRARDAVWAGITPETARLHLGLWSRVARHVPERHRAAPAALLAVAAWQLDDEPLARAALRVATEAAPGYAMAVLMERALSWGLPADRWAGYVAEHGGVEGLTRATLEREPEPDDPQEGCP
ncbi:DUF4192 domain-containing protein [Nocardiopsis alba]|uniref:DUF4192 domain-containing protein n=1 Tax=Nocardiopsis alba TaxID=53437 RepID=A0ABV5DV62_9ACTN